MLRPSKARRKTNAALRTSPGGSRLGDTALAVDQGELIVRGAGALGDTATLSGGTLTILPGVTAGGTADDLRERYYAGDGPDNISPLAPGLGYLGQAPVYDDLFSTGSARMTALGRHTWLDLDQGNPGGGVPDDFYDRTGGTVAPPIRNQDPNNFGAVWSGSLLVGAPGSGAALEAGPITLATASDDGSTWWVDGQLVLDNNQYQGRHEQTATITLSPGAHEIYVGWYEGNGGANMEAKIGQGTGLSYNSAAMKFIDPTDPAQAGMWASEAISTLPDLTGLTVRVDAPGSAFNVVTAGSVDVGGLELHNGGEVAVGSALSGVNFASIRAVGGGDVALTTNVPVSTPDYSDDGTPTHFVKRGSSLLTLDNSAGVASGEATHFEVAQGTLRAIGDDVLGGATQATLSGGTLDIVGGETVVHDVLAARRYNYANEGHLNDIQSTLLATSPDGRALLSGPLKFDDDGQFASLISGPNDNYMFLFTGQFTAPTDGTYTFRRDWDDDRGVFYVDANQDGAFQSGEKFGNAAWGGQSQSFTLAGGESYGVAIGHLEWGGGSRMDAFYTAPGSGEARIQPGAQPGLWSTVSVAAIDAAGLDLGVTANSTLRASSDADAEFGALTFHNGAVLTTEGAPTGFASTAIAGGPGRSGGIDNTNDVHIGTYDDGGVASTLVKRGSGAMRVENTTPGSIAGGSTSFRIEGGTLTATGDDLLGGAPMVTLAGGTLELCPPTTMPDGAAAYYSFDTVSGTIVFNGGSASGKDGTLLNGAGITSAGMVGSGMTIRDGSSDRLDVPGGVDIGNEWTIATWFNNLHGADNWRTLTRGASADHQIIVENGSNRLGMYDNAGGGNYMPVSPQADLLPGDGWHHLAAVGRADATTAYYLDGALVGTIARRSTSEVSWIGNGDTGWGQSFADVLDEFFVYNRALGQSEVQDLYAAGLAGGYGAPLDMTGTGITVVANSTLKVVGPPSAAFGSLSFQGGTLDIQTPTFGVTFASGAVDGAATSFGVNNTVDVTVDGPYDGGSATVAFTKAGPGALTLAQGATNHGGISVQVGGGRLVTGGPMAAANLNIGSSGNMETGANDVTISDGGQFSAGSLKITGSGAAFAIGGDDLAAAPERLTLGGGTVTFSSGGMPTGLQLWLDASALTGLSDGATVTRWFDNSGMGHDADNVNSDPSYVASGPNGAPVVHFDGDDWMYTSHNFDSLDAHTIIAVSRYTDSDHERLISSRNHNWLFGYHGNKDERWYAEGWIHDTGTGNTDWHIHAGTMSGGTNPAAAFWKDSALLTANDTGSNDTNYKPGQLELGGWNGNSETSTGDVGEVLIFDRVLTSSELNDLGGYLASKYGIAAPNYTGTVAALPINLPTTDLFVAATSTLFADNESTATFGDLVVPGGATLTLAGAPLGFSFDAVSGAGTIDGSLTVRSGLAPGDSAGTLTVAGGLTVVDGLVYEWELGATDSDLIFVGGTLGFEGRWVLRVLDAGGEAYASDRLYLFAGPGVASLGDYEIDLSGAPDWLGWTDPAALRIDIDGNGMYLTGLTAIPEPATISLLGLGALWLVRRRRRAA